MIKEADYVLCKRQIDIHSRFGLPRIAFLSFVSTIIMFLICYEIMYYLIRLFPIIIFQYCYVLLLHYTLFINVFIYFYIVLQII